DLSFFFTATAPTAIYTLSLHDALPISKPGAGRVRPVLRERRRARRGHDRPGRLGGQADRAAAGCVRGRPAGASGHGSRRAHRRRSEEHTSELQSPCNLVCRLLLEKKKK